MEPGYLRIDARELKATADKWRERSTDVLAAVAPLSCGQPFQPTTAAVASAGTAIDLTSTVLNARRQATTSAVEASAAEYLNNEATAAAEMAAVAEI